MVQTSNPVSQEIHNMQDIVGTEVNDFNDRTMATLANFMLGGTEIERIEDAAAAVVAEFGCDFPWYGETRRGVEATIDAICHLHESDQYTRILLPYDEYVAAGIVAVAVDASRHLVPRVFA